MCPLLKRPCCPRFEGRTDLFPVIGLHLQVKLDPLLLLDLVDHLWESARNQGIERGSEICACMYVEQEEAVSSFAIGSGIILFTDYEYKHSALRRIYVVLCHRTYLLEGLLV